MRNLSRGIDIFMPHELNKVKWSIHFHFFVFRFVLKPFSLKLIEKFRPKEAEFSRVDSQFWEVFALSGRALIPSSLNLHFPRPKIVKWSP